jgi:hypothetical protein
MSLAAFTHEISASFADDALVLTEDGRPPIVIAYRDHPEVFGHPRFFMARLEDSEAMVRKALRDLMQGRVPLLAPKIAISFDRPIDGGVTEIDKKIIEGIFTNAGARKIIFRNA